MSDYEGADPPVRAFVLTHSDDPDYPATLQREMEEGGDGDRYKFATLCEPRGSGDSNEKINAFVALDCDGEDQAKALAAKYFHSTLVIGKIKGALGLKNI